MANTDPDDGVGVAAMRFRLNQLFRMAPDIAKKEKASLEFWRSLPEGQRGVVILLVRERLLALLENMDQWVPDSLTPDMEDWLKLELMIQMPPLDSERVKEIADGISERRETINDLFDLQEFVHSEDAA